MVNLDTSGVVREKMQALPQDRWVVITVSGEGAERKRSYHYYDAQFRLRASRHDASDYRADNRPWFIHAGQAQVHKTEPYLFQHLQAPGQTYSMRIPGQEAVLAVDIALASLSEELVQLPENAESKVFLYQRSGELIASSEQRAVPVELPVAAPLELSEAERQWVASLPVLSVSNESDWPPFDFTVAGEPQGYAIDLLSLISQMTGLRFRYINGYNWPEFQEMFSRGELDILQPVLGTAENVRQGKMSEAFIHVPFGVLRRKGRWR